MIRSNLYKVTIEFKTSGVNNLLFSSSIPYLGSTSFTDDVEIYTKKIVLNCRRSSIIDLEKIFYNHNSSIYNQIIKSLVYYYALNFNCPNIKKIHITRQGALGILDEKTLEINSIIQPITNRINSNITFNPTQIQVIFQEDNKAKALLIALSYWLKAMSINDPVFTFERLWRGLNSIYSFIGARGNDTNCHIALRSFTLANPAAFPYSKAESNNYNSTSLRNSFRWRELILNDYSTFNKTRAFRDFILRYSDERIMNMLNETLPYRQDFLTREGIINDVTTHIATNLATTIKSDCELISILCIKYSYFVRNKSFHGEKIDGTFRLVENKEIKELEKLNRLSSFYLCDLINSNNLY